MSLSHMLTFKCFEILLQMYAENSKKCGEIAKSINLAVKYSCKFEVDYRFEELKYTVIMLRDEIYLLFANF